MPKKHPLSETESDQTPQLIKLTLPPNARLLISHGPDFKVELVEDPAALGGPGDGTISSPSPK